MTLFRKKTVLIVALLIAVAIILSAGVFTVSAEEELYLSDLTPIAATEIKDPATGTTLAGYSADSVFNPYNGSGNTLLLNGIEYTKGIGLMPYCDRTTGTDINYDAEVEFDISQYSGNYNAFTATVGRRDWPEDVGPYTYSMVCSVYVDDVLVAQSPSLTFGEEHEFCINISGASKLKLVTNKGTDTEHYDCSVWANAKIKKDDSLFHINSIELTKMPNRSRYAVGEDLETVGGKITVMYTDGTSAEVPITKDMVSGYDPNVKGKQSLTIQYQEKQFSWDVYVVDLVYLSDLEPVQIEVLENDVDSFGINTTSKGQPIMINSVLYKKGIGVHPSSGESAVVAYDISQYSNQYNMFYAIVAKDDSAPVEGHYIQCYVYGDDAILVESDYLTYGDELIIAVDVSGISKLTIEITNGDDGHSWDSTCIADCYLTTGNVIETKFQAPTKEEYKVGESLNMLGSRIVMIYDSGFTTEMLVDATMTSGFDSSVPGTQTITVTYNDNTYTFDISVVEEATSAPLATATPTPTKDPQIGTDDNKGNSDIIFIVIAAVLVIVVVALVVFFKKKK